MSRVPSRHADKDIDRSFAAANSKLARTSMTGAAPKWSWGVEGGVVGGEGVELGEKRERWG